ncbi:DDE family transposase [Zavarzinia compransoris]|nr:transposase [Zavarzinia compransoris]TDP46433.1 DDE family transposase [Zavarzinia compransoris]
MTGTAINKLSPRFVQTVTDSGRYGDGNGLYRRWLLIRRGRADPNALAYYFAFAPEAAGLPELAGAAGLRWTIEECFLRAKDDLGLDHCEARSWTGWHRHMSLVMMAAAFLAKLAADLRRAASGPDNSKPNETSPISASAA